MGFFNKRFRNITVLLIVIILCIIAATVTFRDYDFVLGSKSAAIDFFSPVQEKVSAFFSPVAGFFNTIRDYVNLREKYLALQEENRRLRQGYAENINLRIENRALREMLEMDIRQEYSTQPAKVIGFYQDRWQSEALLNVGKKDGVEEGMGVISEDGLVGVVTFAANSSCQVRLINDPASSIGARILTSRTLGVLEGSQNKSVELKYISGQEHVFVGDIVLTSELSEKLPPEILIGRIRNVSEDTHDVYKYIEIEPFVDLKNIEYVMVIKSK
ncbi:MAG: rod shape-determining protein MreC [Actinomycetota bacterium]